MYKKTPKKIAEERNAMRKQTNIHMSSNNIYVAPFVLFPVEGGGMKGKEREGERKKEIQTEKGKEKKYNKMHASGNSSSF